MKYTFSLLLIGIALLPTFIFGQMNLPYEPLAPLPGTTGDCADGTGQCIDFERYLPTVFTLLIGFAGVIAVVQIVIGGVMYLSTDAIQGKSAGRAKIFNALTGLILIIASYIILNTINPRALNLNLTIQSYNPPQVGREEPQAPGNPNASTLENRCKEQNPCRPANACPVNNTCDANAECKLICRPTPTSCPGGTCSCVSCTTIGSSATNPAFQNLPIGPRSNNQLDTELATRLNGLVGPLQSAGISWFITEAYPPTRVHQASCHREGTCVDADVSSPTTANVVAFYNLARGLQLRVVYETSSQAEADALIRAGIPRATSGGSGVLVLPANQITGNHFSVYKQ